MTERNEKKIIMCIAGMRGGGAERVASVLLNAFKKQGFGVSVFATSMRRSDIIRQTLDGDISITVPDGGERSVLRVFYAAVRLLSSFICRLYEMCGKSVPAYFAYLSFKSQYFHEISSFRSVLKNEPDASVIAFLQPSIPIALLAARGLDNKVVISERGDPERLMKKRFGRKFIEKYYSRADFVVFQTEDAKRTYPENIAKKGVVIFNPITPGLPQPYDGERNKIITTFCRISRQKNLPVLLDAFKDVHKRHSDCKLRIIGSPQNADDESLFKEIKDKITHDGLTDAVIMEPFSKNVHSLILKDFMYVNSSDYEGMSNAMLEAMAIGLPCVCTDCPIGGANAVIRDGENGLLVPVGDPDTLAEAIERVISQPEFAFKLSQNARKIREELKTENIAEAWLNVIYGNRGDADHE